MGAGNDSPKPVVFHCDLILHFAFFPGGKVVAGGCGDGLKTIQKWNIEEGRKEGRPMLAPAQLTALNVSNDGKWIVSGGFDSKVTVWDAEKEQKVCELTDKVFSEITFIALAPDSSTMASCSGNTFIISRIPKAEKLRTVRAPNIVRGIAYSPDGKRIATTVFNHGCIIWDSQTGNKILDVPFPDKSYTTFKQSVAWRSNDHLLISISKQNIPADTRGSVWSLDVQSKGSLTKVSSNHPLFFFLTSYTPDLVVGYTTFSQPHPRSIIQLWQYTAKSKRWDTSPLQLNCLIKDVAYSPSGGLLAACGNNILSLWKIRDLLAPVFSDITLIHVSQELADVWAKGNLEDAENMLDDVISHNRATQDTYANRAIIRARLTRWQEALDDAQESIRIKPSVIGYIAQSFAFAGMGEDDEARDALEDAFFDFRDKEKVMLQLIKPIIFFVTGKEDVALRRASTLKDRKVMAATLIHTQMSVLRADHLIKQELYDNALACLNEARDPGQFEETPMLSTISLITGWKFHDTRSRFYALKLQLLATLKNTDELAKTVQRLSTLSLTDEY